MLDRTHPLLAMGLLLLLTAGPVAGQPLPMPREESLGLDYARYVREVRTDLELRLQEWVNAWEAGDSEVLARFYADEAVVIDPTGTVVRGRPAVGEYWGTHRSQASEMVLALTQVSATPGIATARGRLSYRVPSDGGGQLTRSGDLLLVFERQRGQWMTRVHAAVLDGPSELAPVATLRGAIRGTGREPRVPELAQIRWRAEPWAGVLRLSEDYGGTTTGLVGAGLGMEVSRVFEARLGYAQGGDDAGAGGPLRSVWGEVRFYGLPDRGVRPYVAAGLARLGGGVVETRLDGGGSGPTPLLGGGLAFDLSRGWGAALDVRNYLLLDPQGGPADHWFVRSRTSNWSVSAGLGFAAGRQREWHDPAPSVSRQVYEGQARQELSVILDRWLEGLRAGRAAEVATLYAADARLMLPAGTSVHGQAGISEYWTRRGPSPLGRLALEDFRASGNLAVYVARVQPRPGASSPGGALVTVFERQSEGWSIRSQLLVEDPDARR